jgi:hypothetical protein
VIVNRSSGSSAPSANATVGSCSRIEVMRAFSIPLILVYCPTGVTVTQAGNMTQYFVLRQRC